MQGWMMPPLCLTPRHTGCCCCCLSLLSGFHFHNLRLGVGKWSVYDHDIRVPMLVAGRELVCLDSSMRRTLAQEAPPLPACVPACVRARALLLLSRFRHNVL
jgi:hypothetical protein